MLQKGAHRAPEVLGGEQLARQFGHERVGGARAAVLAHGAHDLLRRRVRARGPFRQAPCKGARGVVEALVGEHPVDHVPALERGGVIQLARHHQLARPCRPRALGQALGAAHRGRQAHDGLHEPETRRLRGEQQVAAERELEGRREAQPVRGEDRRQRQLLDAVHEPQEALPQLRAALACEAVELVHVHAAAHHATLRAHQQAARRVRHERVDRLDQLADQLRFEEVQGRAVERDDAQRAIVLQAHLAHGPQPTGPIPREHRTLGGVSLAQRPKPGSSMLGAGSDNATRHQLEVRDEEACFA